MERTKLYIILGFAGIALLIVFAFVFLRGGGSAPVTVPEQQEEIILEYPEDYEQDQDRDGVLDSEEAALNLSTDDFDTDGDSIPDADEINVWKTDPTKADTDGDGVSDGAEVLNDTDPLKP